MLCFHSRVAWFRSRRSFASLDNKTTMFSCFFSLYRSLFGSRPPLVTSWLCCDYLTIESLPVREAVSLFLFDSSQDLGSVCPFLISCPWVTLSFIQTDLHLLFILLHFFSCCCSGYLRRELVLFISFHFHSPSCWPEFLFSFILLELLFSGRDIIQSCLVVSREFFAQKLMEMHAFCSVQRKRYAVPSLCSLGSWSLLSSSWSKRSSQSSLRDKRAKKSRFTTDWIMIFAAQQSPLRLTDLRSE